MPMTTTPPPTRLAARFGALLRETLGDRLYAQVRRENRDRAARGDRDSCASHDHCDANMVMLDAFELIVGREPDAASAADSALWDAAWGEWKGGDR